VIRVGGGVRAEAAAKKREATENGFQKNQVVDGH
jgi:hypothetical protein